MTEQTEQNPNDRVAPAGNTEPASLPNDSFWVIPGLLLAGPYPGSLKKDEAQRTLTELLQAGITTFIDLTEERETGVQGKPLYPYAPLLREIAAERGVDVSYLRFEVRDVSVPQLWQMEAIIAAIEIAIASDEAVYVHCLGGVGRTGTVLGCYAIHSGASAEQALPELAELRRHTGRATISSPETTEQRDFVTNWRAPSIG